jgi:hypothetical protein
MNPFGFEIATGNAINHTSMLKFGRNPEIDTGNAADIWTWGSAAAGRQEYSYTFMAAAATLYISSSAAGDTQSYTVYGLDADWNDQSQSVTAAGQTKTEIGSGLTWIRVFRVTNDGATNNAGNIYVYEDGDITDGVPDDAGKVRAHVEIGDNQTLMAIYTIPATKTGYLVGFYASMNRSTTTGAADLSLLVRPSGSVFQVKYVIGLVGSGTGHFQHNYMVPLKIEAQSDIKMRVAASANNTDISAGFDIVLFDY